jgi:hypothetical protein
MITNMRLINPKTHLRNPHTQRTQRRQCVTCCKQHSGDLFNKVKKLNDEDTRDLYINLRTSLLENHPKISANSIDGLTCDQLNRISIYLDYIQVKYISTNKLGYLTRYDILANNEPYTIQSERVVEMTAQERIDARNTLTTILEDFPTLELYCYNLMLSLRVLGKTTDEI